MSNININVNGKSFTVASGNIQVNNGKVIVNGKVVTEDLSKKLEIKIEGDVESVKCDGNVTCKNVKGYADAGGAISCGSVGGNVDAGSSVTCGDVVGNVDAGSSVKCGNVNKSVAAGSSVTCGKVGGDVDAGSSIKMIK